MNTEFSLKDVKPGAHVVIQSGYRNNQTHVSKVLKVTMTQAVVAYGDGSRRFRKENCQEITSDRWHFDRILRYATEEESTKYEQQAKKNDAAKAERERIQVLCDAVKHRLTPVLGTNVKVMRWTTKEDGTPVFKIEVENMTEEQLQAIGSRWF